LGAPLARLEARIALGELLDCFESVRLRPDAKLERLPSMLIYGLKELPVMFEEE
jgi:cytochrome P450